jgi:hypothetical protein
MPLPYADTFAPSFKSVFVILFYYFSFNSTVRVFSSVKERIKEISYRQSCRVFPLTVLALQRPIFVPPCFTMASASIEDFAALL